MISRFALVLLLSVSSFAAESDTILAVLDTQVEAWNRGNIEEFMQTYENSGGTTFVSNQILRGYDTVLQRYRRTYGGAGQMGRLHFSNREVRLLGEEHAIVVGRYHLTRSGAGGGDATGIFTLVLAKRETDWKIVHDHTTPLQVKR